MRLRQKEIFLQAVPQPNPLQAPAAQGHQRLPHLVSGAIRRIQEGQYAFPSIADYENQHVEQRRQRQTRPQDMPEPHTRRVEHQCARQANGQGGSQVGLQRDEAHRRTHDGNVRQVAS